MKFLILIALLNLTKFIIDRTITAIDIPNNAKFKKQEQAKAAGLNFKHIRIRKEPPTITIVKI